MGALREFFLSKDQLFYKRCLILAIILHGFALSFLLINFEGRAPTPIVKKSTKIVHAVSVDEQAVDAEVARLKQQQIDKANKQKAQQAALKKQAADAKAQRAAEQKKLAALKKQQADAAKKLAADKKAQQAALDKLKKQNQEAAKQLKAAQQKNKAEQDKITQQQKALALQKKIQAQKQSQAQSQAVQGQVDKYKALVIEAISQKWLVPQGTSKDISCELYIHLAAGGAVLSVTVTKSSGNSLLDRSAIAAVYKASPLPVPKDPTAFNAFRQFKLTVKPQGYIQTES